ncbi:MAG: DEAD/DEAH box helicase family protein, partial [Malacoplasma sp.]|nr:DEAD/DEAH box helicase family protein [Malacoplasma sp.]
MKFKFKILDHQQKALDSVSKIFLGQHYGNNIVNNSFNNANNSTLFDNDNYYKNNELQINEHRILENIKAIQIENCLPCDSKLIKTKSDSKEILTFDIEMETGTGKTYVYINTIYELNKLYGWSKFIIIVPSIAIREGVYKSFNITSDHFYEKYKKQCNFFIYNSRELTKINDFSTGNDINVMIINSQAFNARGADARRIWSELDQFQSRKPIDVIKSNNPIIIVDEPQKTMGEQTTKRIHEFNPLFILNFSATHRIKHNLIYSLDSIDAMKEHLVKKITCSNINLVNSSGISGYLFLDEIIINGTSKPTCRLTYEKQFNGKIKKVTSILKNDDDIYELSNKMEQYKGFIINNIDKNQNKIFFANGKKLKINDVIDNSQNQKALAREQIKVTISEHLKKECILFNKGIKCLSLFFIDKVNKYRDYEKEDKKGEWAHLFEEIYQNECESFLKNNPNVDNKYKEYLNNIDVTKTHNGYFSNDKKNDLKLDNDDTKGSNDTSAYDLILKNKEKLLAFNEPTRFIFSHSALREGWDNPNIFQLCALKDSNNQISIKQEIGRGLRICVNDDGDRIDFEKLSNDNDEFEKINTLSVIARGTYEDFSSKLQNEILSNLTNKQIKPTPDLFAKIKLSDDDSDIIGKGGGSNIYDYLEDNDYLLDNGLLNSKKFLLDKENNRLPLFNDRFLDQPENQEKIFKFIEDMANNTNTISKAITNANTSRHEDISVLNNKWNNTQWQNLWKIINQAYYYKVKFNTNKLIESSVKDINEKLKSNGHAYIQIISSEQSKNLDKVRNNYESLLNKNKQKSIEKKEIDDLTWKKPYDLIGKIVNETKLSRKTIIEILKKIDPDKFAYFKYKPEDFCNKVSKIINSQFTNKGDLTYYISNTIQSEVNKSDFNISGQQLNENNFLSSNKAITNGIKYDSEIEKAFAKSMDINDDIEIYAKLPKT